MIDDTATGEPSMLDGLRLGTHAARRQRDVPLLRV
ncbi:MAG: hypothetical protein JWN02_38, partial [Acidobacteria bacterium]|nr:hypothetical protein [Acidobacteriota bacterium]